MKNTNTRILVIDDEEMVRDNIEEILVPKKKSSEAESMDLAASILFDSPEPEIAKWVSSIPDFTVAKAANGMEGLQMVRKALEDDRPYAVIFLDMRMPGWDGLETAIEIRKYDIKAEIIFITAFSDRSILEIVEKAGQNVGYHCKPYASEEIIQLATKGVNDYKKLRNLEQLMTAVSSISLDENQLTSLLQNILDQLVTYVDTDMALIGKLDDNGKYEKMLSIGAVDERINVNELVARIKRSNIGNNEVGQIDEVIFARLDTYTIFAVLKKNERLKTEKIYLLELFIKNAAQAIHNAELHGQLLQKEKLSAVGNAIGMVMHDLRSPIKNIKVLTNMVRDENIQSPYLDVIDECAVQASEIFDDFLDFVKETSIEKKEENLLSLIKEGLKLAENSGKIEGIQVYIDIDADLFIFADKSKFKRCISNLVNNSFEALRANKISDPRVEIFAEMNTLENEISLVIKDNGNGISAKIIKTLFEPFVTQNKSNGTGLGLAIVNQFIKAHGGNIKAENAGGAKFTLTLPAQKLAIGTKLQLETALISA